MSEPTPKPRCAATTKKGQPCTRYPVTGLELCIAHAPKSEKDRRGFGGAQEGAGPKPNLKPTEVMRRIAQDGILQLVKPHLDTLGLTVSFQPDGSYVLVEIPGGGAMLHGTSQRDGSISMSEFPDLAARMMAAEKFLDRAIGRPKQAIAVTGDGGGPLLLRVGQMLDPSAADLAGQLAGRLAIEATTGGDDG